MKILCYVAPWCVEQYSTIARFIDKESDVVLMSQFSEIDETKMSEKYYDNLNSKDARADDINPDDFIKRCRLLRHMKRNDALLHLFSMKSAVSNALDLETPTIVISEVVDQYIIDLLRFECQQRGVLFFGLVTSFVNGYFRITSRGEPWQSRDVGDVEVERQIQEIKKINYTPNFTPQNNGKVVTCIAIFKKVVLNWARIPYFFLKRFVYPGQRYNYHYYASYISALNNFQIFPRCWLGDRSWREKSRDKGKLVIFHPLQMYPEATIEYWCTSLTSIEYEKKLVEIVRSMDKFAHFLIKEHPNVIGVRNPRLYKTLSRMDNVTFVPTSVKSNLVLDVSDSVLVWTGSVGFEAALRGKPVLTVCNPYYTQGSKFKQIDAHTTDKEIIDFIENNSDSLTRADEWRLMSNLLGMLRPGHYINDSSWSRLNPEHIKQAKQIGDQIRRELINI